MIEPFITLDNLAIGYEGQPVLSGISLSIARGSFTPVLSATGSQSHANTGPMLALAGSKEDARSFRLGITELLETGTTVNLGTDLNRNANTSPSYISFYNPIYNSDFTISVTQPLLRGAGTAVTTAVLNRARIGLARAGFDFRASALDIIQQTVDVRDAYDAGRCRGGESTG